ncbi:nucleolar and spindle-associated protein 1 [Nothobranchius furzeri]|uniref:Nucleolar and spindle associated protein 1 n=1 Tax=Nothobranchius furzeri TaxID=105023 RepID=A0A1A8UI45_NOTFU|nr:nucleolar and spindle-associated protein 1 [Nothobranchius furzeri]KAF7201256.1 nucleolar and spindle associated protein 1 [Nothobranchius furzeri]
MDLDSMKYADLRSLAKELGLKANGKADKLLKAIKEHYHEEKNADVQGRCSVGVPEHKSVAEDSAVPVFVNTRRGKGNRSKRRLSDTSSVCGAKTPSAAEGGDKPSVCSTPTSQGSKKRKLSCHGEPQTTETDQQHPDTKEEKTAQSTGKVPKVVKPGKIPRYRGSQQMNKTLLKPTTPNFKKIHEAQFNKMESIDTYVQRKTKQMETTRSSAKDLKNTTRASMFSPAQLNKRPAAEKPRHTLLPVSKALQNKRAGKDDLPFRPSVISTRRINVRFSEATCDNEFKRSLVKTPARMSLQRPSSTPQSQTTKAKKPHVVITSTLSPQKTSELFVFTGDVSTTPGTQKKPTFDLKASLSRPLNYKPHKGKLKPFGDAKENASANKSLISNSRQESYKQHKVQSRDDRRAILAEDRKQKKTKLLGARRGLVME